MSAPTQSPGHNAIVWTLRILTAVVLMLGLLAVYTFARVGGIESTNREAICRGRALLEQNKNSADFDTTDRARLKLARKDAATCPDNPTP